MGPGRHTVRGLEHGSHDQDLLVFGALQHGDEDPVLGLDEA